MDPPPKNEPREPPSGDAVTPSALDSPSPIRGLLGALGLAIPKKHHDSLRLLRRSRKLYEQAWPASQSSTHPEDTAPLVRKAVYQMVAAVLRLDGRPPVSYEESRDRIMASAEYRRLFAEVLDELAFLDELSATFNLLLDDRGGSGDRYVALMERMPTVHEKVRRHLDERQRADGVHPRLRRALGGAALLAAVGVAFLVPYRLSGSDAPSASVGEAGTQVRVRPGPAEPREVLDDPTRCFEATYFGALDFQRPVTTRRDCSIEFDWGLAPVKGIPALAADRFSVRWEGVLTAPASDDYTFYLASDDGSRLFLNDEQIVDNWGNHALVERASKPIELRAGEAVRLRIDYYEAGHMAAVQLQWSSSAIEKQTLSGRHISPP